MSATTFPTSSSPLSGAVWMVLAGAVFAVINTLVQLATAGAGVSSFTLAFYQYLIALAVTVPWVLRHGIPSMRTRYFWLHLFRAALAAFGVQLWVAGLAYPVPIWAAIALLMTSPFFVTLGARLFLGERVTIERWLAVVVGFAGAVIILDPWAGVFQWASLLPLGAAALWAGSSLCLKRVVDDESVWPTTAWLLVLLTPFNLAFAVPAGFAIPDGNTWMIIIVAGLLTAAAQGFLALAYSRADAAFVQPFDLIKLPLNVLAGFIVFGWVPPGNLWLGAALIVGASLYLMARERSMN
ncbi:MAG: DMT family transporter [Hyphomicrobiales bacterium]|nr:DMT family transporter [Hyphomicrobiales bacterium]